MSDDMKKWADKHRCASHNKTMGYIRAKNNIDVFPYASKIARSMSRLVVFKKGQSVGKSEDGINLMDCYEVEE